MPRNITVTFDDGSTHVYQNAPDSLTPEQVQARATKDFGKAVKALDGGKASAPVDEPSFGSKVAQQVGNVAAGAVRGAGSIGATILTPIDAAARAMGVQNDFIGRTDRREAMTNALAGMGADPESLAFGAGKLGAEIAGTAGAGGVLAKGYGAVFPRAAPMIESLATGGLRVGGATGVPGMVGRTLGGAATGAATAGLVNPEDAGMGALIGGALPAVVKGAGALGAAMRPAQATPQALDVARKGAAAGYVVPPEDLGGGILTKAASGLSGKAKTAQVASQRNQGVTNALAKSGLGLAEDARLDVQALETIRKQAGTAYEAMRTLGPVPADQAYMAALNSVESSFQGAAKSFPGLAKNKVSELVDAMRQPQFDASDAVDALKVLRNDADIAFRAGDTGLGKAYRKVSEALEGALERHGATVGQPDAVAAFKAAREAIAKTYTVQRALNSQTGDVAANKLAALLEKGKPISGDLRTIAEFSSAFSKATQLLKETPKTLSPLDFATAAMGAGGLGPIGAAGLIARPAARSALLSGPVQSNALRGSTPNALQRLMGNQDAQQLMFRTAPLIAAD